MTCTITLGVAGIAIGLSLWALMIATRTRDLVSLLFTRGKFTPFASPFSYGEKGEDGEDNEDLGSGPGQADRDSRDRTH